MTAASLVAYLIVALGSALVETLLLWALVETCGDVLDQVQAWLDDQQGGHE